MPFKTQLSRAALAAVGALFVSASAAQVQAEPVFNRVAMFPVTANLPSDRPFETETSPEIIAVTADGMTAIYTDSPLGGVGVVDISDPAAPKAKGFLPMDGEPTSVAVMGSTAYVAVNTSENYVETGGELVAMDVNTLNETGRCDLGGQPDAIALAKDGAFAAIAIENERDEDLGDGGLPQAPAGFVAIVPLRGGALDCAGLIKADLTGIAEVAPEDPEPEFVDVNAAGEIVVTLQENNHIAILDRTGAVKAHFSAGAVDLTNVDLDEEGALTFDGQQNGRVREPDAVKWLDNERFVIANEGDWNGGSRGFTIFSKSGEVLFDSGMALDHLAATFGHYPEKRSGNKGVEPEGLEVATFGDTTYIFVLLERSSLIVVYRDTGGAPEFVQALPSGVGPEGAAGVSSRGLLVVANEADLIVDNGARAHVSIFSLEEGAPSYPMIVSGMDGERPIGWGALSGLAADPSAPGKLYAVNDSFYRSQPSIFEIDATQRPARITRRIPITRDGMPAQLLDLEGVALDGEGGFWLASEGRADRGVPHGLYHVDAEGRIKAKNGFIAFPEELASAQKRFGAEGVAKVGDMLWVAIQREWKDDPKGFVKLLAFDIAKGEWAGAVRYPLETPEKGWIGLSEITVYGDSVYIIERDNQIGEQAKIKRLYKVALSDLKPAPLGGELPVVAKQMVRDFLPDLKATGGYVVDKIEGFTVDASGEGFAVTDNDGVDDSSGETLFFSIGKL